MLFSKKEIAHTLIGVNMTVAYILGSVLVVSAVSFVGAFSIPSKEKQRQKAFLFLIPLAIGALLGDAFYHLIPEALEEASSPTRASSLIILGIVSFFVLEKYLRWHHGHHEEPIETHVAHVARGAETPKYLGPLILGSDAVHNFIDGVLIGASYLVGLEVGIATTLAIVLHEIPQEIGDFGVLLYAGYTRATALFYNFLSALTAIVGATLALSFSSHSETFTAYAVPFAAGVFIYIAASDLVPELHRNGKNESFLSEILGVGIGLLVMYLLLFLEN